MQPMLGALRTNMDFNVLVVDQQGVNGMRLRATSRYGVRVRSWVNEGERLIGMPEMQKSARTMHGRHAVEKKET